MDSQQDDQKPIPAFYCCYLLRSTVRHQSLYIGSTPNPSRRLSQHNGAAKGGAKRTSTERLRPWEMVMIVEGFMSRVGALQFEWAWQHGVQSRHLRPDDDSDDEDIATEAGKEEEQKTGKAKSRKPRSQSKRSLKAQLVILHRLLRSAYFGRWPLTVRFFAAEVHREWEKWCKEVDGLLLDNIKVVPDGNCAYGNSSAQCADSHDSRVGSIHQIQANYDKISDYMEKATFLLDDPQDLQCRLCKEHIFPENEAAVVCPQIKCYCANHLICLSKHFLRETGGPGQLIPTHGSCPACKDVNEWPLMMKGLSLRIRGGKELQRLLRKRKRSRVDGKASAASKAKKTGNIDYGRRKGRGERSMSVMSETDDNSDHAHSKHSLEYSDLDDDWMEGLELGSDSDTGHRDRKPLKGPSTPLEIVIEDSEDDDVEVLD